MGEDKPAEDQHGYHLFPQRDARNAKPEPLLSKLYGLKYRCKMRLKIAVDQNPHVKLLLDAMKHSGCAAYMDRHFSCEECDGSVGGGFDSATSENNINDQTNMNRVVTHELIHAFDHCRAHVDFLNNVQHLACSEIRAASLSGDCSLTNEILRMKFGVKQHHQTCVRNRAVKSIIAARRVSQETAEKAVDDVFETCFNDREPFGRIPHNANEANMAYKEFKNRSRYYANI